MSARILIVDDEQAIRESLRGLFEDEGYAVDCAASGEEAVVRFRNHEPDIVFLDIWMPGIDGLQTLTRLRQLNDQVPMVMMSGHATIDTAVKATQQGAFDLVEKPLSSERLLILTRNALSRYQLERENRELRKAVESRSRNDLIGSSRVVESVRNLIRRVAASQSPALIIGEHGTGKLVAARMIHQLSSRSKGPFIEVSVAGMGESRLDSELFGHEKNAFPGALHLQHGKFEQAHHGTIFFDELTDLTLAAQARIMQTLQRRTIQRLGNPDPQPVDVRIVAASARNLDAALRDKKLREDLFYRLNVVPIQMPPLREHLEDIPEIAAQMAREHALRLGGEPVKLGESAVLAMSTYLWPGNGRELDNYMERCHILCAGQTLEADTMPPLDGAGSRNSSQSSSQSSSNNDHDGHDYYTARDIFERSYLLHYLDKHDRNIRRTAEAIGMERSQLYRKLKSLDIETEPSA